MAFANGGNAHNSPYYRAPNVDATPPPRAGKRRVEDIYVIPSTLSGGQRFDVDGVTHELPVHAAVKFRGKFIWALVEGRVHVLTNRGEILLSTSEQREFAEAWEKI